MGIGDSKTFSIGLGVKMVHARSQWGIHSHLQHTCHHIYLIITIKINKLIMCS
ncbi:unnamed protein product, partial [Larinioides sclopetarius]